MPENPSIVLIGPRKSGKSTIGRHTAQMLGNMDFVDTDTVVAERTGCEIEWIMDVEGPEGLLQRQERVMLDLLTDPGLVIAAGAGSIASPEIRGMLKDDKIVVVYLAASVDQQLARGGRDRKPLSKDELVRLAEERTPWYEALADHTVDTNEKRSKDVASQIVAWYKAR